LLWRFVGTLAGENEARDLGAPGLTQIDLTHGTDGQLLLIATPDDFSTSLMDFVHYGCRAVEVASIDPPRLARDGNGKLKVRAVVKAPDTPIGPGACAYEPASETGILLVRREKGKGFMTASISKTGLRP
jgi:hypothetical protein